jgi:hypothetical protein
VEPPEVAHAADITGTDREPDWQYEPSSRSLLAAGVLVALSRRRREMLWYRAFGTRLSESLGDAAATEQALELGADEVGVAVLDRGLRQLSRTLADRGRTPPTVFAAHLGPDHLDLWITPPDENAPYPWAIADDGQIWRLPTRATDAAGPAASRLDPGYGTPAPYPGLVSIGTNQTGRILVDLEVANGLISVHGTDANVRAALAALAIELITSRWSDSMRVTLVGFGRELAPIAPSRLQVFDTVDEVLPELERRAEEDDLVPHYLIVATPMNQRQTERLRRLAGSENRAAAGYVVAGDVPGATWTWDITDDGMLNFDALGFRLRTQLLHADQYRSLVGLFSDPALVRLSNPTVGAVLGPMRHPVAEIGLLGPAEVRAPGPIEPEGLPQATEIVSYLAAHPGGVHFNVLTAAVWPRGVSADRRDTALDQATAWLGGEGSLRLEPDGRLLLGPAVRVDWQVFRGLIAQAVSSVADSPDTEVNFLHAALNLVRGPVLAGRDPRRYVWLSTDPVLYEATALVADAAHRLSALLQAAHDAGGAMDAARSGLRLAPDDEQLWRDLLMAANATGSEHVLRGVVSEICARLATDPILPRLAPPTESLIDTLYPTWRDLAA